MHEPQDMRSGGAGFSSTLTPRRRRVNADATLLPARAPIGLIGES